MKVFLIRHGESEANKNGIICGWLDAHLTEKGKEDAKLAKAVLSNVTFDKIYTSDLIRAKETANIALPNMQTESTPLLREINVGDLQGKKFADFPNEREIFLTNGYKAYNGESRDDLFDRVNQFKKMLEDKDYENVAVFAHAGVLRSFLNNVLKTKIDAKTIFCKNCNVAIFDYSNGVWKLHSWINLS